MKVTKNQLKKIIKEAVVKESARLAKEQAEISAYAKVCRRHIPAVKKAEKTNLLEFFGSSKKTLDKAASNQKDVKELLKLAKEAEALRKKLLSAKLSNASEIKQILDSYVGKLYDLYELQDVVELDPKSKSEIAKPFAYASNTLKSLTKVLNKAANDLFAAVPKSSGLYSLGQETKDIEAAQKKFMMGPGQRLVKFGKDALDFGAAPGGVGRSAPK